MKPAEKKEQFILARAEGKSYAAIAKELGISKSTCTKWESELADRVAELKAEKLNQLYDSFYMTKEARIEKLGETLQSINDALGAVDFAEVPPEKLLDFKLKYTQALKEEYIGTGKAYRLPEDADKLKAEDLVGAFADLLNRVRSGTVTEAQANRESIVLANLLKAYDAVELQSKIDALEAIIGGRE